jgi:antitoxin component YwqK of YwqJK toxin-antitoxin module
MKIIFAIMFCLSAGFASSQTIIKIIPPKSIRDDYKLENISDTAFIEAGHSEDMGQPYGHYYRLKSNVPDGEYLIYLYDLPDLRAFIKNSQKDSVWTTYNSSGTQRSVTPYQNGLINGDMIMFYNSGSVLSICRYDDNQITGPAITFYESRKIKYITFYENGEYIKQEVYEENGN